MDQQAHGHVTPAAATTGAERERSDLRADRIGLGAGLVVGVPLMLVGAVGILRHTGATPIGNYLRFFIGADIVHDLIVAPVAAVIAFVVLRNVPTVVRAPLRAALFGSAVAVAVAWPGIRHYGRMRTPDNPTVQPLNYATATLTVVGVVVAISLVWLLVGVVRAHRTAAPTSQPIHSRRP